MNLCHLISDRGSLQSYPRIGLRSHNYLSSYRTKGASPFVTRAAHSWLHQRTEETGCYHGCIYVYILYMICALDLFNTTPDCSIVLQQAGRTGWLGLCASKRDIVVISGSHVAARKIWGNGSGAPRAFYRRKSKSCQLSRSCKQKLAQKLRSELSSNYWTNRSEHLSELSHEFSEDNQRRHVLWKNPPICRKDKALKPRKHSDASQHS